MADGPINESCLWCTDSSFMQSHLHEFFVQVGSKKQPALPWVKQAKRDLCICCDCMEEYHRLVEGAFECDPNFSGSNKLKMKKIVYASDVSRLEDYLDETLEGVGGGGKDNSFIGAEEEEEEDISSFLQNQSAAELQKCLECPLCELLKYPRLLLKESLSQLLVGVFKALQDADQSPEIHEKHPGVYLLLVHPEYEIRRWAVTTVKSLGPLDWDEYDELEEVVDWVMNALTFNFFVDPVLDVGDAAWNEGECVQLPKHLFVHNFPKDFWLGLCMFITAMDANCIRMRLMSTTGGHRDLIDPIVEALKYGADNNYSVHHRQKGTDDIRMTTERANATIFWPAMQCLATLLAQLESRFWQFASCDAKSVLESVLSNPYFHFELKRWALNGKEEDDCSFSEVDSEASISEDDWKVSNSQLVYKWDGETPSASNRFQRQTELESHELSISQGRNSVGQLRTATFSWTVPFVQSLLDFGVMMTGTIGAVFTALHSIFTISIAGDTNFEYFDINTSPNKEPTSLSISKLVDSVICNESLLSLSRLVELLFAKNGFIFLLKLQRKWLPLFTEIISMLLCSSKYAPSDSSGMQRTQHGLDLPSGPSLPSSISHIVSVCINMLNSAEAKSLPKSTNFLSALSAFSPKVRATIPVQTNTRPLHRKPTVKASAAPRAQELSNHLLTILKKCDENQGSFSLFDSLCQNSSPSNTPSQTSPPEQPPSDDMEACEEAPSKLIAPQEQSTRKEWSVSPRDTTAFGVLHSPTIESDSDMDMTPIQDDQGKIVAGGSTPSSTVKTEPVGSLKEHDSSDSEIAVSPLARKRRKLCNTPKAQRKALMDSSDDMDDFEPSLSMSQISRTTSSKKPRMRKRPCQKLLASLSEGSTEELSSGEPCRQHPSLPGSSKRPSTVMPKNSVAPPTTSSSLSKVPGTSGTSVKAKKQSITTSPAKSSAKSISSVEHKGAKSCSQITTPKRKLKLEHQSPPFHLHLESDVSGPESSTSSISLSNSVRSDSRESSDSDFELPSFSAMMESFAESDKDGQPIKKAKYFKELLCDHSAKGKASSAKKPKTKKLNERHRAKRQKSEKGPCVRAAKSTSKKTSQRLLPTPSTDPLRDGDEIVIISSASSSSTEPLSPTVSQSRYPSRSSSTFKMKQEVLDTERLPSQELKQGIKASRTSHKVVSKVREGELPSPLEATEWFDQDDIASIHGIDRVVAWIKRSMKDDKTDLAHLQAPENPSVVDLMDDLSGQVIGETQTHSNYSSSSNEYETAIQLAAAQYAGNGSTKEETSGGDMDSLKLPQAKESASVPSTTVQPSLPPPCYSELQYPAPSRKKTNLRVNPQPMLKLKEFSLNIERLNDDLIEKINQRIAKRYVPPHQTYHKDEFLHSNLTQTHHDVDKTSSQKEPKHKVCSAPAMTVSVDLSLLSSPESPSGVTGSNNLHTATADDNRLKNSNLGKPNMNKASQKAHPFRENVDRKWNPSCEVKTPENGRQKLQKLQKFVLSENHSTKRDEYHKPSVAAEESLTQLKSPTENETNSTTTVPDKQQALKQPESLVITATLAPYHRESLSLDDTESCASTTALPLKPHALLLEKPVDKHVQRAVPHLPPIKPPYVPHTTLPTESSMMRPPSTRRTGSQNQGGARVPHSRPIKHVCVNTKPKTVRKMDQFYCEVLRWDPTQFMFPQEAQDGQIIRPYPSLTENPVPIPEVFESYEHYCCVFSPLLLLELWEDIFQNIQDRSSLKPPPCNAQIESVTATSTPNLQLLKCKAFISLDQARQYAHPVERDLVIVDFRDAFESRMFLEMGNTGYFPNFQYRFGVVELVNRLFIHSSSLNQSSGPQPSVKSTGTPVNAAAVSGAELTLNLKVFGLEFASMFSLENLDVQLNVVTSLTTALRQWNGLINIHTSQLIRDILYPRGGAYFGLSKKQNNRDSTFTLNPSMYNEFQIEAIQSAVEAVHESYALPRICLLQGPPGTGKTRTISGLIRAIFKGLPSQQSKGPALPGQQWRQLQHNKKPHILVCAPSNAGVDEIVRRLMKEGQVTGTTQWRKKCGSAVSKGEENQNPDKVREGVLHGLRVVRVGQQQKIHPDILPISLDELAKKNLAKDMSSPQSLPADELKKQISELEQKIQKLERELTVLSMAGRCEEIKALEQRVAQHQKERTRLHQLHREAKTKQRNSKREQSLIRKKILLNADIICATLCGSGSVALMECVQNNPLHFTCVIVDEAAQCNELDVLVPLRYLSSKLVLVGDPLQLPATIKSQKAISLGFGQSLFERLYKYFSRLGHSENPVKMLRVQYRMLPEICQFPSDHFYHGRLKTSRSMQLAGAGFKFQPFLMFDVFHGNENYDELRSVYNREECQLVVAICQLLLDSEIVPTSVGIITPYKAQERVISKELHKSLNGSVHLRPPDVVPGKSLHLAASRLALRIIHKPVKNWEDLGEFIIFNCQSIEVGTVDGFQGREKDIIILSCVRAKDDRGSIGFLSNRQRMNVALTRCKRALYIVGHLGSLKVNKDWHALIRHAQKCNAIIPARDSHQSTAECIRKRQSASYLLTSTDSKMKQNAGNKNSVSTEIGQKKRPLDASTTDVHTHTSHIKKKRLDSETGELHLVGSDHGQPEMSCSSSSSRSNCPPAFSRTIPFAAKVLKHHSHALPSVAGPSTTEDCNASQPASVPPKCEAEWKPHGGPRNRVAHQDSETIQKRRNSMAASSKWSEPSQPRTDKKKKNIRELLSSAKQ